MGSINFGRETKPSTALCQRFSEQYKERSDISKKEERMMKSYLTGILLFSTIILGGCGNHLSINEEQLNQDLLGRSITVDDESIEITRENLKKAEVVDTQEDGEQGKVFADIRVEVLEEEKGEAYKQHTFKGEVVIPYKLYEKE
ncbi:hypothetical protein [Bacillus sp. 37MA]|uniref:hypothetical protein n=1 Tax=Bacillus sp. 37MA TaxID=1132442 RepID=UPI0003815F0B|nr:hypothetical protein [Bacillus sp. 37MA]